MTGVESVLPYGGTERKDRQIRRMFDTVAEHYDCLNHLLALGIDRRWRRKTVDILRPFHPEIILDIASGTGDLALLMCRHLQPKQVTGADISREMMAVGIRKARAAGLSNILTFEYQDCMALSCPDNSYDTVTVAFGIRNFLHLERGLSEIYRVLKPGGHIAILELSTPTCLPVKQLYRLYTGIMIAFAGGLLGLERAACNYLPVSIKAMPQGQEMVRLIKEQGFEDVNAQTFTLGICSLYTGMKR